MKKIVICEDHPIYAKGMSDFLKLYFNIIDVFDNGKETLSFLKKNFADILLLDLNLPDINGLELMKLIKAHNTNIKTVIISMYNDKMLIEKCKKAGANAYCSKNISNIELLEILDKVKSNSFIVDSTIKKKITNNSDNIFKETFQKKINLTSREKELIKLFSEGLSTKQIASKLFVSSFTINTHKKNIYKKLNINSTAELVKFYYENLQ